MQNLIPIQLNSSMDLNKETLALNQCIEDLNHKSQTIVRKLLGELLKSNLELAHRKSEIILRDAEIKEANAQALYDLLTELPNKRLFKDRFNQSMFRCKRNKTAAALLSIDLDLFKLINEQYGHAGGDLFLIETAKRMKSEIRDIDTLARLGGDEFVIILTDLSLNQKSAIKSAITIANKICNSVAKPVNLRFGQQMKEAMPQCSASIGGAILLNPMNDCVHDLDNMLALANQSMFEAKHEGGNQVKINERTSIL